MRHKESWADKKGSWSSCSTCGWISDRGLHLSLFGSFPYQSETAWTGSAGDQPGWQIWPIWIGAHSECQTMVLVIGAIKSFVCDTVEQSTAFSASSRSIQTFGILYRLQRFLFLSDLRARSSQFVLLSTRSASDWQLHQQKGGVVWWGLGW